MQGLLSYVDLRLTAARSVRTAINSVAERWMPDFNRRQRAVNFIIKSRTDRKKFFSARLFSEPAWDMLLRLYSEAIEKRAVSVSALATTADVELSAANRWVTALEQERLVTRTPATEPGGDLMALSESGWFAMDCYFESMSSGNI